MQKSPQISYRGIAETAAIRTAIKKHIQHLERFFPRMIGCRVVVDATEHTHRKRNPYHVRIEVSLPGPDIVTTPHLSVRENGRNLYMALGDAFSTATRQLKERVRIRRGEVKHHEDYFHVA